MSDNQTTTVVSDQWTPHTLMEACVHIRSLNAEIEQLRAEVAYLKNCFLTGKRPV